MWSCSKFFSSLSGPKNIVLLVLVSLNSLVYAQELKTTFIKDFDHWKYEGTSFETVFLHGLDEWRYSGTTIRSLYKGDWNRWKIGQDVNLRTIFNNDFSRWEISTNGAKVYVETIFFGDYTRWRVSGDAEGEMRTLFNNDFERWNIDVDFDSVSKDLETAVVFVAIFTAFHRSK